MTTASADNCGAPAELDPLKLRIRHQLEAEWWVLRGYANAGDLAGMKATYKAIDRWLDQLLDIRGR